MKAPTDWRDDPANLDQTRMNSCIRGTAFPLKRRRSSNLPTPRVHFPQHRLYFFPEPHGQGPFSDGVAAGGKGLDTRRFLCILKCFTNKYAVTPTRIAHTRINPTLSVRLNNPEDKNQISAIVHIPIQVTPYQGLLIFFMTQGCSSSRRPGQYPMLRPDHF